MPVITKVDANANSIIHAKTKDKPTKNDQGVSTWWKSKGDSELLTGFLGSASYLKEKQQYRYRQANLFARMYSNMPLFGFIGTNLNKMSINTSLPQDRSTCNVVLSCVDTLHSRLTQSKPKPVFLTDGSDYKQRNLAKQLNTFINGEFYQTRAYELGETLLRDAEVFGSGCVKIYENDDNRVCLERKLLTELLFDENDALYDDPRQMYEFSLVERSVLLELFPSKSKQILAAMQSYPTANAGDPTVSDQVMVVEGWHLKSGKKAKDGMHVIACSECILLKESFDKPKFPFVFMHYSKRLLGPWGQGIPEQLMGTQSNINKLMITIDESINLIGVPKVFVEEGSKVVNSHLDSRVGTIVKYRGTMPSYQVPPCVAPELYERLDKLIAYAYQQTGVSALSAAAQKPAGLNSGEAIRNYDDLQSDRFASISKRYETFYTDLAYQIIDLAKDICKREGKYQTVYPGKDGTKQIDLPSVELIKDDFVIQCFTTSSLPRDPAGRLQKVTEMIQAGMITIAEGRRLLDFADLSGEEKLANAAEERILYQLDKIVEDNEYDAPDAFTDLQIATTRVTQYYNLYMTCKLPEDTAQLLRDYFIAVQTLKQAATPPPPPAMPGAPGETPPQANPEPLPTSPLVPNANPGVSIPQ
jgi:hypothetical protein